MAKNDEDPVNIDDMLHALGRPDHPKAKTYRNHYCVSVDTPTELFMRDSNCWIRRGLINENKYAIYSVTEYGREVLLHHKRTNENNAQSLYCLGAL